MGRKKVRKRDRRREQRARKEGGYLRESDQLWTSVDTEVSWDRLSAEPVEVAVRTCGGCREFVQDPEGGRGTCEHPASGVLSPWPDTEACPYYSRLHSRR